MPYFRGQRWNVGGANEIADRVIIEKSTHDSHMLDVSMIIMVSYAATGRINLVDGELSFLRSLACCTVFLHNRRTKSFR